MAPDSAESGLSSVPSRGPRVEARGKRAGGDEVHLHLCVRVLLVRLVVGTLWEGQELNFSISSTVNEELGDKEGQCERLWGRA